MKKISLLFIACFAVLSASFAVEGWSWPASFDKTATGSGWWGPAIAEDATYAVGDTTILPVTGFAAKLATASSTKVDDFTALWNMISGTAGKMLNPIDAGTGAELGEWKATTEGTNIYVLVKYPNGGPLNADKNEKDEYAGVALEIMISPYFKIDGYVTGATTPADAAGVPFVRFSELGGHKFNIIPNGDLSYYSVSGQFTNLTAKPAGISTSAKSFSTPNDYYMVVTIPFADLDNTTVTPIKSFTAEIWKSLTTGISFDVKYIKGGYPTKLGAFAWSSSTNDTYYSTVQSGRLKLGEPVGIEGASVSSLSIAGDIISAEANIQIFNGVGQLVKSGASEISISGLAAGTYIAVSAGQSLKFQVK